jgi:hypothetical protein
VDEGLDDLSSLYLDSTAVKANSERPTDSGLMTKLVERICRRGSKLDRFGLPNFNPSGLEELQEDLRRMHREIGFSTGKPKKQGKVKKLYYQLLRRGRRVGKRFARELATVAKALSQRELPPSQRLVAEEALELIGADIEAIGQVAAAGERRILAGEKLHREGRVEYGGGLSAATGPERARFRHGADRADGQRGRQRSIGGGGAGSLGAERSAAAVGQ